MAYRTFDAITDLTLTLCIVLDFGALCTQPFPLPTEGGDIPCHDRQIVKWNNAKSGTILTEDPKVSDYEANQERG